MWLVTSVARVTAMGDVNRVEGVKVVGVWYCNVVVANIGVGCRIGGIGDQCGVGSRGCVDGLGGVGTRCSGCADDMFWVIEQHVARPI